MPRIYKSGSSFPFIPLVEFLEIFKFYFISTLCTLVPICANIHPFNWVLT